jgi:hypothetical protein
MKRAPFKQLHPKQNQPYDLFRFLKNPSTNKSSTHIIDIRMPIFKHASSVDGGKAKC